jgi:membrane protease YdiL (CAAX protease family)
MASGQGSAIGWITAIAVAISVGSYVLSLGVGVAIITSTQLGAQLSALNGLLIIFGFLLPFQTVLVANGLWLVILSMFIFVICFIKAASTNGGFISGLRLLLPGSRPRSLPNWLAILPILGSGLFMIVLALTLIQSGAGVSTGSLNCPDGTSPEVCAAELFAGIVTAPVAEEIGFRITAIGLVVAVLVALRLAKSSDQPSQTVARKITIFFSAFLSPGYAKEKSGLPSIATHGIKGISKVEWVFLLITSAVFGAYHVFGGGGWGPGKFLTAALSGFALGIVYLAYGAFADILLHWFFNFYLYVFSVYTAFNGVFVTFGELAVLGTLALGVWAIILGAKWSLEKKPQPLGPIQFSTAEDSLPPIA